jgi:hypothetical protein
VAPRESDSTFDPTKQDDENDAVELVTTEPLHSANDEEEEMELDRVVDAFEFGFTAEEPFRQDDCDAIVLTPNNQKLATWLVHRCLSQAMVRRANLFIVDNVSVADEKATALDSTLEEPSNQDDDESAVEATTEPRVSDEPETAPIAVEPVGIAVQVDSSATTNANREIASSFESEKLCEVDVLEASSREMDAVVSSFKTSKPQATMLLLSLNTQRPYTIMEEEKKFRSMSLALQTILLKFDRERLKETFTSSRLLQLTSTQARFLPTTNLLGRRQKLCSYVAKWVTLKTPYRSVMLSKKK